MIYRDRNLKGWWSYFFTLSKIHITCFKYFLLSYSYLYLLMYFQESKTWLENETKLNSLRLSSDMIENLRCVIISDASDTRNWITPRNGLSATSWTKIFFQHFCHIWWFFEVLQHLPRYEKSSNIFQNFADQKNGYVHENYDFIWKEPSEKSIFN